MLAVVVAFLVLYRWWKQEKALYETHWKIKYSELDFTAHRGTFNQNGVTGSHRSLTFSTNDVTDNKSISTDNRSSISSLRDEPTVLGNGRLSTSVARLNKDVVVVKKVHKKTIREDKILLKEMQMMKGMKHTSLATFYGACTEAPHVCVLWEFCSKGSLQDLLDNPDIKLESLFQFSIAADIASGLHYIHHSELGVHGNLKATNCVVDSRWVAKLTDFGLKNFRKGEKRSRESVTEHTSCMGLLWTAPELLRPMLKKEKATPTKASDIYSLGIVLKQLFCKNGAYELEMATQTPQEIVEKVAHPVDATKPMRPYIGEEVSEHASLFKRYLVDCWAEDPSARPTIKKVLCRIKKISPFKTTSVLDNMLALMERYSTKLEDLVSERTLQLEEEKRKTDTLLYRMLPRKVADNLKRGEHVQAEAFQCVTIYFSDIVGFTSLASESQPMEIVEMLNLLYSRFDDIISNYDVYKVETIGDAYMIVSGCPIANPQHASVMAHTAVSLLDSVLQFCIPHRPGQQLRIRVGLNSGPVVAGVVGNTMPRYCLFGDTVNLASRMESTGLPLKIQISASTYDLLQSNNDFMFETRRAVEVKGKGMMTTYWLSAHSKADNESWSAQSLNFSVGDSEDGRPARQRTQQESVGVGFNSSQEVGNV